MNFLRLLRLPGRRCLFLSAAALAGWGAMAPRAWAHAELLVQIEQLNKQLEQQPKDASLYLRRGELHRMHAEYDAAWADYEHASGLAPRLDALDLARGRLFLDAGWPLSARTCLDRFVAVFPRHGEARVLRARVLAKLELRLAAAGDYDQAIQLTPEPGPDLFIERAGVLAAAGPEHLAAALRGLDEGIKRLGPVVTLQLYAIDMELKRKEYDKALERLKQVASKSPRQETWLARRGEILQQAGRTNEARVAYKAALDAFQSLPPARRSVPAMLELERRIRRELDPATAIPANADRPASPGKKQQP